MDSTQTKENESYISNKIQLLLLTDKELIFASDYEDKSYSINREDIYLIKYIKEHQVK